MRINPYKLKRPDVLRESRAFTDPLQPGMELSVSLAADPGRGAQARREEMAERLAFEYVPVSEEEAEAAKKAGAEPRTPKTILGTVTRSLCFQIATLIEMQELYGDHPSQEDTEKPYDFAEWILIAQRMPSAFTQCIGFAGELLLRAEGKRNSPNSSTETTAPPSESPLTDSTEVTTPS